MPSTPKWPGKPSDPVVEMQLPRHYGSVPTLFGSPRAESTTDLAGADIVFLGVPWQAPVPDSRMGAAGANYFGTNLTPSTFRTNSVKYGGFLPELDADVFERLRLVDYGDVEIANEHARTFDTTVARVSEIIRAGAMPFTLGGNSGPATYGVLKAVAQEAGGPVAVVNFDAHHDNLTGEIEEDDPRLPRWGGTWARRILDLPNIDPARYTHIGLRGPRNDREVFQRFIDKGARRENIHTFWEIARARRSGYEEWVQRVLRESIEDAAKVWLAVDPDVLDLGQADFGDEPLGLYAHEVCWGAYEVGRLAGRERFGGIAFMAMPFDAMKLHWIMMYVFLYAMAGVIAAGDGVNA
jgi:arginase family enzyme